MRLPDWLKRRRLDEDDFEAEVRSHLAMATEERIAGGEDENSARLASLKEFGNVTLTTEAARREWTPWWIDALRDQANDVRYAIRTLAANPMYALTVVAVLALGIGVNATVFTMLKAIAFSPIAGVNGSAALQVISGETSAGRHVRLSYPDYRSLRDQDAAFAGLMGSTVAELNLGRGRSARRMWGEIVTGNYFDVLGIKAERGRTLRPSDEIAPGGHPVVVISDGLWRRDFGADPSIVGRSIEINNQFLTVVGVTEPGFHGTTVVYDVEAYVPVMMAPVLGYTFGSSHTTPSDVLGDRNAAVFYPQGYLRTGVTRAGAIAQTAALWTTLARDRPLADPVQTIRVLPFWRMPLGAPSILLPTLTVVSAMAILVLLIACANIAGLVLVRGLSRRGDIAVRLALGATRTRIVRLLLAETMVLAVPAAAIGVFIASRGIPLLVGYAEQLAAPERVFFNVSVDAAVLAFAAAVACLCTLALGLLPALQTSRVDLVTVINEDASPRSLSRGRLRPALVVTQVAVSLLLLVGSGLASRSVDAARRTDPGFDAGHVASLVIDVKQNGYDPAHGRVFYRKLLDAARADAGVESATLAAYEPLQFLETRAQPVALDGYIPRPGDDLAFMSNTVGPAYFRTLRIPVAAGREFDDRDGEHAAPAAIVNRTLAERYLGGASPAIGKRIRIGGDEWRTIVGVVADIKYIRIDEAPRPYVYLPFEQAYRSMMVLHTRGNVPVDRLVEQARTRVAALDGEMPIIYARPMSGLLRGATLLLDLAAAMLLVFGVAGMALAALGTYGLVSYTARQSTHEIGIRMALGATSVEIVRRFAGRGVRLGAIGTGIGVSIALVASRLLGTVLYGVTATDAVSFARAIAIVLGGIVLATLLPAWRAARTNPIQALRHQ